MISQNGKDFLLAEKIIYSVGVNGGLRIRVAVQKINNFLHQNVLIALCLFTKRF